MWGEKTLTSPTHHPQPSVYPEHLCVDCECVYSCTASNAPRTARSAQAYDLEMVVSICLLSDLWLGLGALRLSVLWSPIMNILNSTNYGRNHSILRVNMKCSFYNRGCC